MTPIRPAGPEVPPASGSLARPLLQEIADLAASPLPEQVFLQELLKRAVAALRAEAGVIWMYDAERRLVMQCEIRMRETGFFDDFAFQAAFERPFSEVIQSGGVLAHEAEQATPQSGGRRRCALLGALQRETKGSGVLQVFETQGAPEEDRTERLRLLEQICGQATRFWQQRGARAAPTEAPAGSTAAEQWTLAM